MGMEIFEWKMRGNDWINLKYVGNNWNCVEIYGNIWLEKGNNLELEEDKIYEVDIIKGKGINFALVKIGHLTLV